MSIIKGTNQIVAGFGGTKRSIGEVYFSQSSLATDNSGALPLFTGETIASANTIYPEFYNWVTSHTELQCTSAEYEAALTTYGECAKYVVDENGGTTTGTITVYGWLASGSTFYTKTRNPVAGDSVWPSTDTTQESIYTVISLSNDTLTFSGPTKEWSGTYSTTTTGTGLVITSGTSLRLPKLSNYIKAANPSEGIKNIEAGLPNITGYASPKKDGYGGGGLADGAFWLTSDTASAGHGATQGGPGTRINFDASRSSSIYGKSSTVTPASTTLYPWVVAYTAAIPASTAQAAEFQQGLSGKADTNLGNLSTAGKALASGLGMPSNRYIDLTLGASGSTYTAPANGYFCLRGNNGISGDFHISFYNQTANFRQTVSGNSYADWVSTYIPAKKSDVVNLLYNNLTAASHSFLFIYAEGAE